MNKQRWGVGLSLHRLSLVTTACMPLCLMAAPAYAQDQANAPAEQPSQNDAGEIVVTATRQSQLLSRVPISVVAKTQLELDKQGVRSIGDVARLTPGITFGQSTTYYGTGQSSISIRGVDSGSGIPTTGVYIDDTPVQTRQGVSPSLSNPYPQVFDLDRVEVLRGPQGTLFGSGSVGGAIRFISPKPEYQDVSIYSRAEIAATQNGAPSFELGLAGGAPLVEDKLGFRASVWTRRDGGYIDRLDRYTKKLVDRDINGQDVFSARFALGWKASETLTITPSIFYQNQFIEDGSRFELATSDPKKARYNLSLNKSPESRRDRFYLPALKMELDLGTMSLVSDSSYFTRRTRTRSDDASLSLAIFAGVTGGFLPGFEDYTPTTRSATSQKAFTQELRLQNNNSNDRFNWIVGLFYQKAKVRDQYAGEDARLLDVINVGLPEGEEPFGSLTEIFGTELYQGRYSVLQRNIHNDDQKAVYAQADYEIVDGLKVTLGGRYTIAKYRFDAFTAGPLFTTDGQSDSLKATSKDFTPKLGLSYQADQNNFFYANAAKGVRGPGVSPAVGATCAADGEAIGFNPLVSSAVNPDSIWSYELGSKNRLFGGLLQVDASVYRINWKNVQTILALPGCQQQVMLNLGNARIEGFDLALTARPVTGLTLGASVSYTKARYTTAIPGPEGTVIRRAGEPLAVAPWSVQLNGEYAQPVGDGELYGRADYTYTSHNDTPLNLDSPLVDPAIPRAPASSQLNLRVGGRFSVGADNDADFSLFVNNVTNSHPIQGLFHDTLDSTWFRAGTFRPRTAGLTLTLRR
ncbi:TonB-dependent receptor [Sphingobium sp. HBC34]|uniref:TonB-dependent receptor n=1 Tax=Sphingobium cyanobacteriorum TaxID=3063954 RepID=A0ABT8ZNH4_9SPHN|nr:TonB-dependent receptor [Sphingobium sp. HBC34]MDO7835539.1 TonB-dependent receptor [Sphingobium sp. HBC34]